MKKITISLSAGSVRNAIDEIERYKAEFNGKCLLLCDKLLQLGISVAKTNLGKYEPYIVFSKVINDVENGIEEILVMSNTGLLHVEWLTVEDEVHSADVSPILMAEFGSGWYTDEKRGSSLGVVQGSLNTYGHAKDQQWHYKDFDGNWHTSKGYKPTYPLLNAENQMISQIKNAIKEVFR